MDLAPKLPQGYRNALRCLVDGALPRQTFSADIARAMERSGHAMLLRRASPFPAHQGKAIDHLALTNAGRLAAEEMEDDGLASSPQLQPGRTLAPALAPMQGTTGSLGDHTDIGLGVGVGIDIGFWLGKSDL